VSDGGAHGMYVSTLIFVCEEIGAGLIFSESEIG
jgi:hypothetical protein